jgi:hypothetical protein
MIRNLKTLLLFWEKTEKSESIFYPMFSDFHNSTFSAGNGGITMTGEN